MRDPLGARVAVIATAGAVAFAASGVPADAAPVAETTGAAQFVVAGVAEEATGTAVFAAAGVAVGTAKSTKARRSGCEGGCGGTRRSDKGNYRCGGGNRISGNRKTGVT